LNLRDAAYKKIFLEVALLKAIEARSAISIDSVLKQLNQLRRRKFSIGNYQRKFTRCARGEANHEGSSGNFHANRVLQEATPVSADLAGLWTQLVEAVGKVSPFTRSYLVDANPISFEKNILVIGFDPEFEDHLGLVDNARNHTLLQTKLAELGQPNCQIKFIKAEAPIRQKAEPMASAPVAPTAIPQAKPVVAKPVAALVEKKSAPVSFQQKRFQERSADPKALGNFQRPDCRSPRLILI